MRNLYKSMLDRGSGQQLYTTQSNHMIRMTDWTLAAGHYTLVCDARLRPFDDTEEAIPCRGSFLADRFELIFHPTEEPRRIRWGGRTARID